MPGSYFYRFVYMLRIGDTVDNKYKILSEIGHGGMSTVYLAINEKANKQWAVKEVRKNTNRNFEILRQSLIAETDLLKKLQHPNLPSIVDVIDSDEDFLIVMDYIEGDTLENLLINHGAQPQEKVVEWAKQLCDVLIYLHMQPNPIIYRDMKPSNIMLKADGNVALIDFGTAREFKEKNAADTVCLGTCGYAAPEQFGGMGQTDARTDIYCLGATMYHLLTGHNPSEPPYEMYPITKWNPELSTGLEKIIIKCTQKNPDDRYSSAGELMYALEHYRDFETARVKDYKKRLAVFLLLLTAAVLSLVTALSLYAGSLGKKKKNYEYMIDNAGKMTHSQDAGNLYIEAINIDGSRAEAYHAFYELIVEDGSFTEAEEDELLRLNASAKRYLQEFASKNPMEYADFCYEIGNAYWYYYEHEESRQTNAVVWFEEAVSYYENNAEKQMEYQRCRLYIEIGNFYKRIITARTEGTDMGMYGEYWAKLCELKQINDQSRDRELITLRMYREIVNRTVEYARYLYDDGVEMEEILKMLDSIEKDIGREDTANTLAVKTETEYIERALEAGRKMIKSTYITTE